MLTLDTIRDAEHAFVMSAVRAAIDCAVRFHSMADYLASTMLAGGRQGMNCALEGVKDMLAIAHGNGESLVVLVAAYLALAHGEVLLAIDGVQRIPSHTAPTGCTSSSAADAAVTGNGLLTVRT